MIASCGFLESELRQFSKEEGVAPGQYGNAWCRLENKSQEVGAQKEQVRRKDLQGEVLTCKEE